MQPCLLFTPSAAGQKHLMAPAYRRLCHPHLPMYVPPLTPLRQQHWPLPATLHCNSRRCRTTRARARRNRCPSAASLGGGPPQALPLGPRTPHPSACPPSQCGGTLHFGRLAPPTWPSRPHARATCLPVHCCMCRLPRAAPLFIRWGCKLRGSRCKQCHRRASRCCPPPPNEPRPACGCRPLRSSFYFACIPTGPANPPHLPVYMSGSSWN
jgi:hypothetical protein